MNKKYELTTEFKMFFNVKLFRIKRLLDGALGGYIEKEANLAQNGSAWVYNNARVSGNAYVFGDAQVYGNAYVSGNARAISPNSLLIVTGALNFLITVTPQNVFIGCQLFSRFKNHALKVTAKKAKQKWDVSEAEFLAMQRVVKLGCNLVKREKVFK